MSYSTALVSIIISLVVFLHLSSGQNLDAINILASCGSDCWTKDPNNRLHDHIRLEPEVFDDIVVRCMQTCFTSQTKKAATDEKLPPPQVIKIKVSSYCGYICYHNNKQSKKSLDFCYAGCLGTILQPKIRNSRSRNTQIPTPTRVKPRSESAPII